MPIKKVSLFFFSVLTIISSTQPIFALIREDTKILLAPVLQVITGTGTTEEIMYVATLLGAASLLVIVLAINITLLLHKFTLQVLIRIFSLWLIFISGVSIISLTIHVQSTTQLKQTQAQTEYLPRNVQYQIKHDILTITWTTDVPVISVIHYWSNSIETPQIAIAQPPEPTTNHKLQIKVPPNSTKIWFTIWSNGKEYGTDQKPLTIDITRYEN